MKFLLSALALLMLGAQSAHIESASYAHSYAYQPVMAQRRSGSRSFSRTTYRRYSSGGYGYGGSYVSIHSGGAGWIIEEIIGIIFFCCLVYWLSRGRAAKHEEEEVIVETYHEVPPVEHEEVVEEVVVEEVVVEEKPIVQY